MKIIVTDYLDYRKLLHDLYEDRKATRRSFTYRELCKKAGFSSAGFFTKILQGKSNISVRMVFKLAEAFRLTKTETDYFESLVMFNQAASHDEKRRWFEKLVSIKKSKTKTLAPAQFELFDKWYYVAIRELLDVTLVKDDFRELAKKVYPAITPAEARGAIAVLERIGLIAKDPTGYYKRLDTVVSTGDEWESLAIQHYQLQTIELAREALYCVPKGRRDISTLSLSISGPMFARIREKLKEYRRELLDMAKQDDHADRVYQMNLQLFPLSAATPEEDQ